MTRGKYLDVLEDDVTIMYRVLRARSSHVLLHHLPDIILLFERLYTEFSMFSGLCSM